MAKIVSCTSQCSKKYNFNKFL